MQYISSDEKDSLRQSAERYWEGIDVDKYQPVLHGREKTAEEKEYSRLEMEKIAKLTAEYRAITGEKAPEFEYLFPDTK